VQELHFVHFQMESHHRVGVYILFEVFSFLLRNSSREPCDSGCGFRTMAIRIPKRCRSRLRSDADHDSDAMPITNRDRFGMVIDMS